MALDTRLQLDRVTLNSAEEERIHQRLRSLERRLARRPAPSVELVLKQEGARRQVHADLRLRLGPLGPHLISHQSADTADLAVRLAVEDAERQLERKQARQRGEDTYGVPSRRLPKQARPHPPDAAGNEEAETPDAQ